MIGLKLGLYYRRMVGKIFGFLLDDNGDYLLDDNGNRLKG